MKDINEIIEALYKTIDAQNKTINEQALEISQLKDKNKHIEQWWKETNVIIRNEKSLAVNDNAMEYILSLEQKIDKAREYIKEHTNNAMFELRSDTGELEELLKLLGDGNNE